MTDLNDISDARPSLAGLFLGGAAILAVAFNPDCVQAQFPEQAVNQPCTACRAHSVYAADLDGDGDADVLSASRSDDRIAWYENTGGGNFSEQKVITTEASDPRSVFAQDLDGDGDPDVLSASSSDNKIAWYENQLGESGANSDGFGDQQVITTSADRAQSVHAADLDGDGDPDVLSASLQDNKIAWYENTGGGSFSDQKVITTEAIAAFSVFARDLDGDGDPDVLSASDNDEIAWYENQVGESGADADGFGSQQVITTEAGDASSVFSADIDGDGDVDVLSASEADDKIAWYENTGGGSFSGQKVITTDADKAWSVFAQDLDGDGDPDVLSASLQDNKVAWYENTGGGSFSDQKVITTDAKLATSVFARDLDGDEDADVVSAFDSGITWHDTNCLMKSSLFVW